ncbi:hypothetical protein RND81_01G116000 [Saponaria officinalis]|uniref:DUF6598 domain-containing protein n=1 Tax=Saponaria officinalis TaxID=3572 RepID=A0AAW1NDV9_SAPOF
MATEVDKKRLYSYLDVMVTPLVQIFGVTIHCDDDELLEGDYEIYGQIRVTDKLDQSFYMFNQDKNHPQRISFDEPLLLTSPLNEMDAVIIPSEHVSMDVLLFDRVRYDMVVAKGSISLDRTISGKEWFEEYLEKRVFGVNNLYANVQYAIFPYAVTANIDVFFFVKDDNFDSLEDVDTSGFCCLDSTRFAEVNDKYDATTYSENACSTIANLYGTVSATCAVNQNDGKFTYPQSLLFRKPNEDSIEIESGSYIDLSRSVVAVPAYSSLKIQASLSYRDSPSPAVSGDLEFTPDWCWKSKKDIVGDNGRIRVRVTWRCAYKQLYRVSSEKRLIPLTPQIEESKSSNPIKRSKPFGEHHSLATVNDDGVSPEQQPTLDLSGNCILPAPSLPVNSVVEVYSVVVCSKDRKPFKFYGSVRVDDGFPFPILSIDQSCPQDCPNSGMHIIPKGVNRHARTINQFCVHVDLMDVTGDAISRGSVHLKGIDIYKYPNRRWCFVVRGGTGFAAIHFSAIPDAVVAAVDVKLLGTSLPGVVKGEIYACHGNWDPPRSYHEQLFRSVLFYGTDDSVLLHEPESALPLQKSVVSLPRCSYLTIKAALSLHPICGKTQSLEGDLTFTGNEDSPKEIGNADFHVRVSVKFFIP